MSLEWVAGVPADWHISKAQFVLDYQKRDVQEDDEIVTAFRDGQVTLRRNRRTDGFTMAEKEIGYQHICEGDLVVHSMDGGFGAIGVSESCGKASPVVHAYTSSLCDLRFVAYQLRAAVKAGWIAALAKGIRVRSTQFDRPALASLNIAYPTVETQRRIADYLDRETAEIDAAVADLDKYVELLEKRRQVLVSEAVDSLSSASLIKTVRNLETLGWLELGRGKVISKEDMENSPGDYPVYSSAFTDNGFFGKYGEYLFEDERISWSIDGGGMPFYRHKHRYSLTNVSGWMRVADNSVLDVKYLYYAVLNEWYRNSFDYAFKAHPSVIRDLYSISIPALSSQQQMADYLDRETAEIDNLIAESKKLRDLLLKRRSVLITEVATGRKQV